MISTCKGPPTISPQKNHTHFFQDYSLDNSVSGVTSSALSVDALLNLFTDIVWALAIIFEVELPYFFLLSI